MNYLPNVYDLGAETGTDAAPSHAAIQARLQAIQQELNGTQPGTLMHARLQIDLGRLQVDVGQARAAWDNARAAFDVCVPKKAWQPAVEACDVLFRCEQDGSLSALGQGVWLAVTFPIEPELSVAVLQHIVEATPTDADGAAVAAACAAYIVALRCEGKQYEDLSFYTQQMLSTVARRHSGVTQQQDFEAWMARLELDQPDKFLVRLRNVIDVLVQDDWWIDRDAIRAELPSD